MKYFQVHIMTASDAHWPDPEHPITLLLPYPSFSVDETVHEVFFFKSGINFDSFPQLKKMRLTCVFVFEKYFRENLFSLMEELKQVVPLIQANTKLVDFLRSFLAVCEQAAVEGKGIVCTGD